MLDSIWATAAGLVARNIQRRSTVCLPPMMCAPRPAGLTLHRPAVFPPRPAANIIPHCEANRTAAGVRSGKYADHHEIFSRSEHRKSHRLFIRADGLIGRVRGCLLGRRRKRLPLREPQRNFLSDQGRRCFPTSNRRFAMSPWTMASSASGPEKKFPVMPSRVPLDCDEGAIPETSTSWVFGSRRASAVNRTSDLLHYVGQRGDFLARRVVQARGAAEGLKHRAACVVRRLAGRTEYSAAAARTQCRTIPRARPSGLQAAAGPLQARAMHQRCHSDGDAESRKRISSTASRRFRAASSVRSLYFHRSRSSREIAPSESVTILSAHRSASPRSCVTMMMVLPGPDGGGESQRSDS